MDMHGLDYATHYLEIEWNRLLFGILRSINQPFLSKPGEPQEGQVEEVRSGVQDGMSSAHLKGWQYLPWNKHSPWKIYFGKN